MESAGSGQNDPTSGSGGGDEVQAPILGNGPSISIPTMSLSQSSLTSTVNNVEYLFTETRLLATQVTALARQLATSQETISQQRELINQQEVKLKDGADSITALQSEMQRMRQNKQQRELDRIHDLKVVKGMASKEREEKDNFKDKYEELKSAFDGISTEVILFSEDLKGLLLAGETGRISSENVQGPQDLLAGLREFAKCKIKELIGSRNKFKADLKEAQQVIRNLVQDLEAKKMTAPSPKPKRTSSAGNAQQQVENPKIAEQSSRQYSKNCAKNPRCSNSDHGEDLSKRRQGLFCLCGNAYSTRTNLCIHIRTATEKGIFKCSECGQRFVLFYMVKRHLKVKHNMKLPDHFRVGCSSCGSVYANSTDLNRHKKIAHSRKSTKGGVRSSNLNEAVGSPAKRIEKDGDISILKSVKPKIKTPLLAIKTEGHAGGKRNAISISGKKHGLNLAKRCQGFYCRCDTQFITRKGLDNHVQFHMRTLKKHADLSVPKDRPRAGAKVMRRQTRPKTLQVSPQPSSKPAKPGPSNVGYQAVIPGKSASSKNQKCNPARVAKQPFHGVGLVKACFAPYCLCGKVLKTEEALNFHVKYHATKRTIACPICNKLFSCRSSLNLHMKRQHNDKV